MNYLLDIFEKNSLEREEISKNVQTLLNDITFKPNSYSYITIEQHEDSFKILGWFSEPPYIDEYLKVETVENLTKYIYHEQI